MLIGCVPREVISQLKSSLLNHILDYYGSVGQRVDVTALRQPASSLVDCRHFRLGMYGTAESHQHFRPVAYETQYRQAQCSVIIPAFAMP